MASSGNYHVRWLFETASGTSSTPGLKDLANRILVDAEHAEDNVAGQEERKRLSLLVKKHIRDDHPSTKRALPRSLVDRELSKLFSSGAACAEYMQHIAIDDDYVNANMILALLADPRDSYRLLTRTSPFAIVAPDGRKWEYVLLCDAPDSKSEKRTLRLFGCETCHSVRLKQARVSGARGLCLDEGVHGQPDAVPAMVESVSTENGTADLKFLGKKQLATVSLSAVVSICGGPIEEGALVEHYPDALDMEATRVGWDNVAKHAKEGRVTPAAVGSAPTAAATDPIVDAVTGLHIAYQEKGVTPPLVVKEVKNYHACQVTTEPLQRRGPRLTVEDFLHIFGCCNFANVAAMQGGLRLLDELDTAVVDFPESQQRRGIKQLLATRLQTLGKSQKVDTPGGTMKDAEKALSTLVKISWEAKRMDMDIHFHGAVRDPSGGNPTLFTVYYGKLQFCTECLSNEKCECSDEYKVMLRCDAQSGPALEIVVIGRAAKLVIVGMVSVNLYSVHADSDAEYDDDDSDAECETATVETTIVDNGNGGKLRGTPLSFSGDNEYCSFAVNFDRKSRGNPTEYSSYDACHADLRCRLLAGEGLDFRHCAAPKVAQGCVDEHTQAQRNKLLVDNGWDGVNVVVCAPPEESRVWRKTKNSEPRMFCRNHPVMGPAFFGRVLNVPGVKPGEGVAQVFRLPAAGMLCVDGAKRGPMPDGAGGSADAGAGNLFAREFEAYVFPGDLVEVIAVYLLPAPPNSAACPIYFAEVATKDGRAMANCDLLRYFQNPRGGVNIADRHGGPLPKPLRHAVGAHGFPVNFEKRAGASVSGRDGVIGFAVQPGWHITAVSGEDLNGPDCPRPPFRQPWYASVDADARWQEALKEAHKRVPIFKRVQMIASSKAYDLLTDFADGVDPTVARGLEEHFGFSLHDAQQLLVLVRTSLAATQQPTSHEEIDQYVVATWDEGLSPNADVVWSKIPAVANLLRIAAVHPPSVPRRRALAHILHDYIVDNESLEDPESLTSRDRRKARRQAAKKGVEAREARVRQEAYAAAAAEKAELQANLKAATAETQAATAEAAAETAKLRATIETLLTSTESVATEEPSVDATRAGMCAVCMDAAINVILKPCNHVAICMSCYDALPSKKCPICRLRVVGAERVYIT